MAAEQQQPDDPGLRQRIRGISAFNFVIGVGELTAGIITNNSTLTMAGVHDVADGELYRIKHRAACEADPARKRRLRRRGAIALMGVAGAIGGYEVANGLVSGDQKPENNVVAVGILAAGANIAAAVTMHGKRHHHDAKDTWRHIIRADLPSSLVTLVTVPLSVRYPGLDTFGAVVQTGLAINVGSSTLRQTNTAEGSH